MITSTLIDASSPEFIQLFLLGLLNGLVLAAPMGPVFAATIRVGVAKGFKGALAVQLGSLTGDIGYAALGLTGAGVLAGFERLRIVLGIVGALVLLWFAWGAFKSFLSGKINLDRAVSARGSFALGAALSFTNVDNLLYWLSVGSLVDTTDLNAGSGGYVTFLVGFLLASLGWCFGTSLLVALGVAKAKPSYIRYANLVCAILLSGMAALLLFNLLA